MISFNSRPSCDGRQLPGPMLHAMRVSIHARLATGDYRVQALLPRLRVSIHARLATGDLHLFRPRHSTYCFNSRPSCDGRHPTPGLGIEIHSFNSRPSCDGRRCVALVAVERKGVSIHARLATGDPARRHGDGRLRDVSIHARLATGDLRLDILQLCDQFQFTPVLRRATSAPILRSIYREFQFTPVLRRAT